MGPIIGRFGLKCHSDEVSDRHTVRDAGNDFLRTVGRCCLCRPHQGASCANEIINDDTKHVRDIAREQVTRDDAGTAMFLDKRLADRVTNGPFKHFTQRSVRLPPPKSGDTTQIGQPAPISLTLPMMSGAALSATDRQRKAFSKAASL